ncbi:hypothetical protein SAMN02910441_02091 [Ruminococcus sp. YE282]|nr:hypothetical protein SAMN02910441_02091 [Ruminococcus bromii]
MSSKNLIKLQIFEIF